MNTIMISLRQGKGQPPKNLDPENNICLVCEHQEGTKDWWYGSNIVTNDGDIYYAQQSAYTGAGSGAGSSAPSPNFFACSAVLQNPSSADAAGSNSTNFKADNESDISNKLLTGTATASWSVQAVETGYPKANDQEADNTGKGTNVVTYKFTWTTGQINTGSTNPITGGAILATANVTSSSGNAQTITTNGKILTRWNFASPASFHKTSTDTLTLFVNHTMSGTG